jgi:hypothetical protein
MPVRGPLHQVDDEHETEDRISFIIPERRHIISFLPLRLAQLQLTASTLGLHIIFRLFLHLLRVLWSADFTFFRWLCNSFTCHQLESLSHDGSPQAPCRLMPKNCSKEDRVTWEVFFVCCALAECGITLMSPMNMIFNYIVKFYDFIFCSWVWCGPFCPLRSFLDNICVHFRVLKEHPQRPY